jgi:hypothetical protein
MQLRADQSRYAIRKKPTDHQQPRQCFSPFVCVVRLFVCLFVLLAGRYVERRHMARPKSTVTAALQAARGAGDASSSQYHLEMQSLLIMPIAVCVSISRTAVVVDDIFFYKIPYRLFSFLCSAFRDTFCCLASCLS